LVSQETCRSGAKLASARRKKSCRLSGESVLKNLDALNPEIAAPRTFSSTLAVLPLLLGILCLPLAFSAAPSLPFAGNGPALLCAIQSIISFFLIIIPRIFRWDWRTKYFGVPLLYVGSVSIVGIIPWLGILCFSILPIWFKFLVFWSYVGPIVWWCTRFSNYYTQVFANEQLRKMLYEEDIDAIYYHQRNDDLLFKKRTDLTHFPSNSFFILSFALAGAILPFSSVLGNITGTPMIHWILAIIGLPIVLTCFGFSARAILIFYYFPYSLKRETGKDVYVIMG
jgi:hypothetical protein